MPTLPTKEEVLKDRENEGWKSGWKPTPPDFDSIQCNDGIISTEEQQEAWKKGVELEEYVRDQNDDGSDDE